MTAIRKKPLRPNKNARLKALREQVRRGLYPIDSNKLTIALTRVKELSLS